MKYTDYTPSARQAPLVVIAPDSYKGSATATEVAEAIGQGLHQGCPESRQARVPMADGGEGMLDCIAATHQGVWRRRRMVAIHGHTIDVDWFETCDGVAVIESARVLGLPLIQQCRQPPGIRERSSRALGILLRSILDKKPRRILIGLGGSACNDAGLGLLTALGCVPRDRIGRRLSPDMNGLLALDSLACDALDPRLADVDIRVLCDVDNPLLGPNGASRVYGPQKGLDDSTVAAADAACQHLAGHWPNPALATAAGSGAAGGLGFALAAIGGQLQPGADTLIEMSGLHAQLTNADLVITGEGRSDMQTLSGKLPLTIARLTPPRRCILVAGAIDNAARDALEGWFGACHALTDYAGDSASAQRQPARWLQQAGERIGRDLTTLTKAAMPRNGAETDP